MVNTSIELLRVEHSVSVSAFRKRPTQCFESTPVAVLLSGRPVGYLLSAELFEKILSAIAQYEDPVVLQSQMNLSDSWLRKVTSENHQPAGQRKPADP